MNPVELVRELQEFTAKACPEMARLTAFTHVNELCAGSVDLSKLEAFKTQALALVVLAQATDAVRAVTLEQFKLVEAISLSVQQGKQAVMEKAWHDEGFKRNSRITSLKKIIPEFKNSLRSSKENVRTSLRRRLEEFQGELNTYVSCEFVEDNANTIWNLSDRMANGLKQQALSFAASVFPSLNEFCRSSTDQASQIVGTKLASPINIRFSGQVANLKLAEDNVFGKIMGVNSAIHSGGMYMDVMGLGTLGKWFSVGNAPQRVREQHVKKNSTHVRNFSRQFTADLFHDISLNLDRLERYLLSSLDTSLKGTGAVLNFLGNKRFRLKESPGRLDFSAIVSQGTTRFEPTIKQLDEFRRKLNTSYQELPGRILN